MILTIILFIICLIGLICSIIFTYEIKHAPLIDEYESISIDDELEKNVVGKYTDTFCAKCKFFDGTATCLHSTNFGLLENNIINMCKKESFFEPK